VAATRSCWKVAKEIVLPVSSARTWAISAPALHDLGGLEEQPRALGRRALRPGRKGLGGGVHGNLGFRPTAIGDTREERPVVGLMYVEQPLAFGGSPFAAREILVLADAIDLGNAMDLRHRSSPSGTRLTLPPPNN
jgi:hypothetical protein